MSPTHGGETNSTPSGSRVVRRSRIDQHCRKTRVRLKVCDRATAPQVHSIWLQSFHNCHVCPHGVELATNK